MKRFALLLMAATALGACGEAGEEEGDLTTCTELLPVRSAGDVGDLLGTHRRSRVDQNLNHDELVGELTSRRITLLLGELEFTPAGGQPEMRPRILTIQTNLEGTNLKLQEAISERNRLFGPEFEVIDKPEDQFCDPNEGELCVRFGLDNTENNELISDTVIHTGQSGTITVEKFSAGRIHLSFDVEFGPNIKNEFDESSGHLEGCFDARVGAERGGVFPLEVPCGDDDPRDLCNQATE
jgi:hypothetical protein